MNINEKSEIQIKIRPKSDIHSMMMKYFAVKRRHKTRVRFDKRKINALDARLTS